LKFNYDFHLRIVLVHMPFYHLGHLKNKAKLRFKVT